MDISEKIKQSNMSYIDKKLKEKKENNRYSIHSQEISKANSRNTSIINSPIKKGGVSPMKNDDTSSTNGFCKDRLQKILDRFSPDNGFANHYLDKKL